MSARAQLYVAIALLVLLGLGLTLYKHRVLGFPLLPGAVVDVWTAEARVSFVAEGGPVVVSLALPEDTSSLRVLDAHFTAPGYGFLRQEEQGDDRAVWSRREASGRQTLYYQASVYPGSGPTPHDDVEPPDEVRKPYVEEAEETAAGVLIAAAHERSADRVTFTAELLNQLLGEAPSQDAAVLLDRVRGRSDLVGLVLRLVALAEVPARLVRGIHLEDGERRQKLVEMIEIHDGSRWVAFDPETGRRGLPENFLPWQRGGESLLDVTGGHDSRVVFSTLSEVRPARATAVYQGERDNVALIDFSIYTLPVEDQNAFKLLLLMPIGALVVVVMRNLVGIRTSGTFMPILIALAFKQTTLLTGLVLFLLTVSVGLVIRAYLTRLNLLLVPRISAVVIVVIVIFAALAIFSHKLGIEAGLGVTFFPMVIVAWTIERMSTLWDEEGPGEVMIQASGSLLVAILAFLAMSSRTVEHLTYSFPELLLVVLATILWIGQYTGYRLTELRRFAPMVEE